MGRSEKTYTLTKGVRRFLSNYGAESLTEFIPRKGCRFDLFAIDIKGVFIGVEVKSSVEDWRSDKKWRGYLEWCDQFYIAVDGAFPLERLPNDVGVLRADGYDAAIVRASEAAPVSPARRRAVLLKFARDAAARLRRIDDPIV